MPMAKLAQYQHCILRRNGVSAYWSSDPGGEAVKDVSATMEKFRLQWRAQVDAEPES